MEGTLVVEEKRSVIDKIKSWYKEKIIDTGISAKFEDVVNIGTKIHKGMVSFLGQVVTLVLEICPIDGEIGEICAKLASPHVTKLVNKTDDFVKNAVVGGKRKIEGTFFGEDGRSEKVEVPDIDIKASAVEAKTIASEVSEFITDVAGKSK